MPRVSVKQLICLSLGRWLALVSMEQMGLWAPETGNGHAILHLVQSFNRMPRATS